jgi:hypothetical protein
MTWSEIMGVLKRLDNNLSNAVYLQRLLHSWAKEISPRSSSGEGREPFARTSKRGARPCPQCDRTSIDAEAINTVTAILIPICQYAPGHLPSARTHRAFRASILQIWREVVTAA